MKTIVEIEHDETLTIDEIAMALNASGLESLPVEVDDKNLLDLYRKFYAIWNRCESHRGCYSCSEPYDCLCNKERGITDPTDGTLAPCNCGRDDLEKLETEIDKLETCHKQGEE